MKDEANDADSNLALKAARIAMLVPYQWQYVLRPIADKVHNGTFRWFSPDQIQEEFDAAKLKIRSIKLDYGGCGYHVHGG